MSIAGLVLAAGGGSRYEGPTHKLLAPFGGRELVVAAIESVLDAGFDEVAVVSGAIDLASIVPRGITLLENADWRDGLATSLRVGLGWCEAQGHDAVVIGLGDTPGVPPSAWRALRDADAEVAVASFAGSLRPPVHLVASLFDAVPKSGDVGARVLWNRPGAVVVECDGDPADVDTAEDLAALEARLAARESTHPPT